MKPVLRAGLHSGQQYDRVDDVVALWRSAEEMGYEWVSLFDHWRPELGGPDGPCLDSAVTLTAGLLSTQRIVGALMVAPAHAYDPGRLAMRGAALHQVSRGRFVLGLGAGGRDDAFATYGIPRPGRAERLAALKQHADVVPQLLAGHAVTSSGPVQLHEAVVRPSACGGVPLAIGGASDDVLRVAGRHADIWNSLASTPARFVARLAAVRAHAVEAGRDPSAVRPSVTFRAVIGSSAHAERRRATLIESQGIRGPDLAEHISWGSVEDCVEALTPYVRAGAADLVLAARPPLDHKSIEAFVTQVVPRLVEVGGW